MNDDFDNMFYSNVDRHSYTIWQSKRQSLSRNSSPVPDHSHNDYWRRIPLFEALGSGCISVEADIHVRHSELLVGHISVYIKCDFVLLDVCDKSNRQTPIEEGIVVGEAV